MSVSTGPALYALRMGGLPYGALTFNIVVGRGLSQVGAILDLTQRGTVFGKRVVNRPNTVYSALNKARSNSGCQCIALRMTPDSTHDIRLTRRRPGRPLIVLVKGRETTVHQD